MLRAEVTTVYPGVDAHLNSILQTSGIDEQPSLWSSFHSFHVTYIASYLNRVMPPNYRALAEQSLQVRQEYEGDENRGRRRPDVAVFERTPSTELKATMVGTVPTMELSLADILDPEDMYPSVVIRTREQGFGGKIVARIELLSPSNMPGSSHASAYQQGRIEAIRSGVPLIEIDYLHEFPPVMDKIPYYPDDKGSTAYMVAVTDPRPEWHKGHVRIHGFGVGEIMPKVAVPLAGDENVLLDLKPIYDETLTSGGRWTMDVDYSQPPSRFDTYSPADQQAIQAVIEKLTL